MEAVESVMVDQFQSNEELYFSTEKLSKQYKIGETLGRYYFPHFLSSPFPHHFALGALFQLLLKELIR